MYQHLLAVSLMLDWAAHRSINVDQRIGATDLFSRQEILSLKEALRADLRPSRQGQVVSPAHFVSRCLAVKDYVSWHMENVVFRMSARDARKSHASKALFDFQRMMTIDLPTAKAGEREGPDKHVQARFLEVIRPDSPLNPFQKQHRVRNYALLLLYWEKGSRRGENLKLKVGEAHHFRWGQQAPPFHNQWRGEGNRGCNTFRTSLLGLHKISGPAARAVQPEALEQSPLNVGSS